MRQVAIDARDVPAGFVAERVATAGTDGTLKLVADPADPVVLRSQLEDLERRFLLLLKAWIATGLPAPAGLERDYGRALAAE